MRDPGGLVHITKGNLERIQIPLPELALQEDLVADIEEEQKVVAGNQNLLDRMEQRIQDAIARVWEG